jgi:hypothetical protein
MNALAITRVVAVVACTGLVTCAWSQGRPPTTEQLGKDPGAIRQEAEQQQSRQLQQQQNAGQQQRDQAYDDVLRQQNARAGADAAQGRAVLHSWQRRPALAPGQNALLGRWESQGSKPRAGAAGVPPEMAQVVAALMGGITGGLCDSMLGRGTVEFRPNGVFAVGRDGSERMMYRAEYRGEGSRVVVLPQGGTSFTHMIIDLDAPNHGTVAAVGCVLVRHGAANVAATAMERSDATPVATWTHLGSNAAGGGIELYATRENIVRTGNIVQMWELWDFKIARRFAGKPFLSARNRYEFDCAIGRRRMVGTAGYSGHMGEGSVVASDHVAQAWEEVASTGPLREELKLACERT